MNKYKNLFLQQSYNDSTALYRDIIDREQKAYERQITVWDHVILSASNESQAVSYREQIDIRLKGKRLPERTRYSVVPDPGGKRVGSGGATLNILKYIKENDDRDLKSLRILVVHSGGDAKRTPQYSACGKIFSPVPRMLPDGHRSTLFDEFMIAMCGIPGRISGGMLVCSGDVTLLFNPLQLDFYEEGAAALSIKEPAELGKNHGVFLGSGDGYVRRFLHKQTLQSLRESGAMDNSGLVNIDTGAVIFSGSLVEELYSLISDRKDFDSLVNDHVRLSFYADFLYPLAEDSTLKGFYDEKPEGEFSPELKAAREKLWEHLHKYRMKLIRFSPASFLHFGTTAEVLKMVTDDIELFGYLGWANSVNSNYRGHDFAASNSYISVNADIGKGCYIEDSYIHHNSVIGEGSVVSGLTVGSASDGSASGEKTVHIPDHTVLHGLKLRDGRFVVRMYGVRDNPKEMKWFGKDIDRCLWDKALFPVRDSMEEALDAVLKGEKKGELLSLKDSFNRADVKEIIPWQEKLNDRMKAGSLMEAVRNGIPVEEAEAIFKTGISKRVEDMLLSKAEELRDDVKEEFSQKIRIYYYLSKVIDKERMADKCFNTIRDTVLKTALQETGYNSDFRIKKDEVIVRLPVRVNWGGGWSDTPPYCMEHGGTVLNAAITLNGELPIEVTLKRINENKIILTSTDIGSYREFTELRELVDCHDPMDAFALQKAALIACGVIPYSGDDESRDRKLDQICSNLGGGIYMNTRVINIPKGSGLGTSSILAGACVKGIYEFLGVALKDNDLYNRVLCMEQIMSTGGGWQDQVGGLAPGIKMVTTDESLQQKIICTPVRIGKKTLRELNDRFAIIYTGQRRLARNLLRDIVGKYIGGDPDVCEVLYKIQQVAVLMRLELEKGHVDGFARLLNEHWELSKRLDAGCTNTCIDQLFIAIEDLICGKMICGAGGGGFIQVVMREGVILSDLQKRLDEVFADSGVSVWKTEIYYSKSH
ncbi:MAG: bifunctional fucokinase/L-fucose-1-P-guanylyltransferase [Lachnospiraceae bacterium]|nr:bifunctional fucokinase/L-fucose-1-P-guanylyltransferase [Lachnospiraceae bacterium]